MSGLCTTNTAEFTKKSVPPISMEKGIFFRKHLFLAVLVSGLFLLFSCNPQGYYDSTLRTSLLLITTLAFRLPGHSMFYIFSLSISYVNITPILYTGQPISLFVVILPLIGNSTLIFFLGPRLLYI